MKEKPILFSGPMIRAILEGRKTETRRVITPQPPNWDWSTFPSEKLDLNIGETFGLRDYWICSKYGLPGDRLWCRETWAVAHDPYTGFSLHFSAGIELFPTFVKAIRMGKWLDNHRNEIGSSIKKWRPSIFMPRWASRITLEITNIWVERVKDITDAGARAEGVNSVFEYRELWNSINEKRGFGFDSDPWVRAIKFKVIEVKK